MGWQVAQVTPMFLIRASDLYWWLLGWGGGRSFTAGTLPSRNGGAGLSAVSGLPTVYPRQLERFGQHLQASSAI